MARWTEQNRAPVDALIDHWRTTCLIEDSSLRDTESVWTKENVENLMQEFVDNPLVDDTKFIQKLELQLKDQPGDAVRLMAENIAVYQAFAVTAVGTDRKRELIQQVLAFCGDTLEQDGPIWTGMSGGIGGPGQGFNSFRPYLLMYLIRFAQALKAEASEARRTLVASDADPWAFKRWLDECLGEPKQGAQTMRNILLHLLFPDTFERIAVDEDKAQVVATLRGVVDGLAEDEDTDVALFQIRQTLAQLLPNGTAGCNGEIDFYYSPLREGWDPEDTRGGRSSVRSMSHLTALEHKRQIVLYGPPGTGKTFEAKRLAERLIRRVAMRRWTPTGYLQNEEALRAVLDKQIERRQLHPAYTYEDFIGGLRLTASGTEPVRGHLLQLVDKIRAREQEQDGLAALPWVLILDELNRADLSRLLGEVFSALDDRGTEIELSAAGSGDWGPFSLPGDLYIIGTMNLIDQSVEQLDFALRRRFLWLLSDFQAKVIPPVVKDKWEALAVDNKHLTRHAWEHLRPDVDLLTTRAVGLNAQITESKLLGPQYRIGHTYFFDIAGFIARDPRLLNRGAQQGHYLWNKAGEPWPPLLDLWAFSLAPLLEEYMAGAMPQTRDKELKLFREAFCARAVR